MVFTVLKPNTRLMCEMQWSKDKRKIWYVVFCKSKKYQFCIFFSNFPKKMIWPRVVVLLFYDHGKHLRSCRDGQLT